MVYDLCVTKDNKYVILGGAGKKLCIFNLNSLEIVTYLEGHSSRIPWLGVTYDG